MKTIKFSLSLILTVILALSMFSCEKEKLLSLEEIPSEIIVYVETHFPDHEIIRAVKEKEGKKKSYELTLSEGVKLEFNNKKKITEIEANSKLPDSVIPGKILNYVETNYPNNVILKWELEGKSKQKIELNNGLELEFTLDGSFIGIDD